MQLVLLIPTFCKYCQSKHLLFMSHHKEYLIKKVSMLQVCVNVYFLEKMAAIQKLLSGLLSLFRSIELTSHIIQMFMYTYYTSLFE
jgi:hypothetical protein